MPRSGAGEVADFARKMHSSPGQIDRLQRGVEQLQVMIGGADHVGVSMLSRASVQTDAATSDVVWRGDRLQYDLGEGPCLDAIRIEGTVISNDLAGEPRWRRWAAAVRSQLGIEAMLSLLLFDSHQTFGALNIYAESPDAFDDDDVETAVALAGHLALALADAREIENWRRAAINRTRIGQAEGILMERLKIDEEQAFAYLRRISQTTHRKLAAVATDLVRTGRLVQPPDPQPLTRAHPDVARPDGSRPDANRSDGDQPSSTAQHGQNGGT